MNSNPFHPNAEALPAALPLFPLNGVLLLPGGRLPLNIFEPRYLSMTTDCFQLGRMIGVIQPRDGLADPAPGTEGLFDTGCAGRLTSFAETGDGRFLIALTGVVRFRLTDEPGTVKPYRMGAVDYGDFLGDLDGPRRERGWVDRDRLLDACSIYFRRQEMETDLAGARDVDDEALVNAIAMACPFTGPEKQALLECSGLEERFELLISLMRLAVAAPGEGSSPPSIN